MGMDAYIEIDGDRVDSYKCRDANIALFDCRKDKQCKVKYHCEEGYGYNILNVYIRDVITGKVYREKRYTYDDLHTITFPDECKEIGEVYACIRGEYHRHNRVKFTTKRWKQDYIN
ncbi:HRF-1 [Operophtera brumata nucleopolyhedrovirus]|uniref:HRF-1 n=1 Tax=Operophtera brumata nucleopolyhedrovirus TaxID=1046267 RepID=A0A2H4UZU1_9ABAC|nr:HRF-1 [Operophtera brumata nucleopolyhedrovirus]AUA60268.1 HRF-1 [Operophtera brumata nucleopolyhedrovirus]